MSWFPNLFRRKTKVVHRWRVFGSSARGASHVRKKLPNQDAIGFSPKSRSGPPLCLAVADGHGSPKSFRSDTGSKIAVEIALQVLSEFLVGLPKQPDFTTVETALEEGLPKQIDRAWKERVQKHYQTHVFTPQEFRTLEESASDGRKTVEENPILAYGSTILAVLVHDHFLACLQLGDGDILLVYPTGVTIRPIDQDARLFANETTSLSAPNSWKDFRSYCQPLPDNSPALLLASTDGYANSFKGESGFWSLGKDFLELMRNEGIDNVETALPGWLDETSHGGSGDDVTAGIVCHLTPQGSR